MVRCWCGKEEKEIRCVSSSQLLAIVVRLLLNITSQSSSLSAVAAWLLQSCRSFQPGLETRCWSTHRLCLCQPRHGSGLHFTFRWHPWKRSRNWWLGWQVWTRPPYVAAANFGCCQEQESKSSSCHSTNSSHPSIVPQPRCTPSPRYPLKLSSKDGPRKAGVNIFVWLVQLLGKSLLMIFKLDPRNWSQRTYQYCCSRTRKPWCSHVLCQRDGVQYHASPALQH